MKFSDGTHPASQWQCRPQIKRNAVEIVLILLKDLQSDEKNKALKIINELYLPYRSVAESAWKFALKM